MKINIELTLEKDENLLTFKIIDTEREFVYNYLYSLATISNINTLCIFIHNPKEIYIKKNITNYMIINSERVEIKTENSYVNQKGEIDIMKLHNELAKLLFYNKYIDFNVYVMPSRNVLENYKIKKYKFNETELCNIKNSLKKCKIRFKPRISVDDIITKKRTLKHVVPKFKKNCKITCSDLLKAIDMLKHVESPKQQKNQESEQFIVENNQNQKDSDQNQEDFNQIYDLDDGESIYNNILDSFDDFDFNYDNESTATLNINSEQKPEINNYATELTDSLIETCLNNNEMTEEIENNIDSQMDSLLGSSNSEFYTNYF